MKWILAGPLNLKLWRLIPGKRGSFAMTSGILPMFFSSVGIVRSCAILLSGIWTSGSSSMGLTASMDISVV